MISAPLHFDKIFHDGTFLNVGWSSFLHRFYEITT